MAVAVAAVVAATATTTINPRGAATATMAMALELAAAVEAVQLVIRQITWVKNDVLRESSNTHIFGSQKRQFFVIFGSCNASNA